MERTKDSRSGSETRRWKKTLSGHDECWRIELTAAIEPRRYSKSRVIATWTKEGLQTLESMSIAAQSAALRIAGDFLKENLCGEVGNRRWEDLIASAGGKDWREGDRTMIANRTESKPENRMIRSIAILCFFFLDLSLDAPGGGDGEG